jgi:hypothetical protein
MRADIDYKFKIDGYRKMTSVGEEYDYALLNVVITGLNDRFSQLLFTPEDNEQGKMIARSFENRLYKFYSDLNLAMTNFLRIFDGDIRTTIDSLTFDVPKPINESRMSRLAVRTAVKDIVNILKNGKAGDFMLPNDEGDEYQFINLPFGFSVELFIEIDNDIEKYIKPLKINNTQYGWYVYIDRIKADFGGVHISLDESKLSAIEFINNLKNHLAT